MAYNTLSLAEKISTKAIKVDGCLIWQGQKDKRGYGFLRLNGRMQRAHRIAFELRHGPIGSGMVILHSCDNPSCVNPDHLSMGTQLANVRDMLDKGRANKATGARHSKTKLTPEQVATARAKHIPGKYGYGTSKTKPARKAKMSIAEAAAGIAAALNLDPAADGDDAAADAVPNIASDTPKIGAKVRITDQLANPRQMKYAGKEGTITGKVGSAWDVNFKGRTGGISSFTDDQITVVQV